MSRIRSITVLAGLALSAGAVVAVPGAAEASHLQRGAFQAKVLVADTPAHTPSLDPAYLYTTGGPVTVGRSGVGQYWVKARGLRTATGNAHVSMFAEAEPNLCTISAVTQASDGARVSVRCFNPATGRLSETSGFMVWFNSFTFTNAEVDTSYATLTTDSSTSSHTPGNQHRSNPGLRSRVTRYGVGRYFVRIRAAYWDSTDGVVIVTARSTVARACSVGSWGPSGDDVLVDVRCFRPNGTLADSRFSLVATLLNHMDTATAPGGSQWVPASPGMPPTVLTTYGYNPSGPNSARELFAGSFLTIFPGSAGTSPLVPTMLVGRYGDVLTHCYIGGYLANPASFEVITGCLDTAGADVAAQFTVMAGRIYFGD